MASFIESWFFKRLKNFILGAGASVVLVGALFKILHWNYADEMLMVGMFTEAFIFLLMGVLPPHKDYYWEKIYPQLDIAPDVEHKKKSSSVQKVEEKQSVTQQLDKMLEEAKIESKLLERLGSNLEKLGTNIEKLNEVTDAGAATQEYTVRAQEAAASLTEMKNAYDEATSAVTELSAASSETKNYHEQVQMVSKNLAALNAVYELELQDTNNHLKAMNKFYGSLSEAMGNLDDSVADTKIYKDEIASLSKNLSQLNGIYGNMLSAMTFQQPKQPQ